MESVLCLTQEHIPQREHFSIPKLVHACAKDGTDYYYKISHQTELSHEWIDQTLVHLQLLSSSVVRA